MKMQDRCLLNPLADMIVNSTLQVSMNCRLFYQEHLGNHKTIILIVNNILVMSY